MIQSWIIGKSLFHLRKLNVTWQLLSKIKNPILLYSNSTIQWLISFLLSKFQNFFLKRGGKKKENKIYIPIFPSSPIKSSLNNVSRHLASKFHERPTCARLDTRARDKCRHGKSTDESLSKIGRLNGGGVWRVFAVEEDRCVKVKQRAHVWPSGGSDSATPEGIYIGLYTIFRGVIAGYVVTAGPPSAY